MQENCEKLCIKQTELGDFLPQDVCMRSDVTPQQLAEKLENITTTMAFECFHWHALAQGNCFFEGQKANNFYQQARTLLKARPLFKRQAKMSTPRMLNDKEYATILQAKKIITSALSPTFGMWKSVETAQSPWTEGLSDGELSAARVAVNFLFTNFIQRVVPQSARKVVSSKSMEAPTPDHQHS